MSSSTPEHLHQALGRIRRFAEYHDETRGTNVIQYVHLSSVSLYLTTEDLNRLIAWAEDGIAARYGPPPRGGH